MKATVRGILYGLLVFCACGCTAPGPTSGPSGWYPQTQEELRLLIGQTVLEAVHQYDTAKTQWLQEQALRLSESLGEV